MRNTQIKMTLFEGNLLYCTT